MSFTKFLGGCKSFAVVVRGKIYCTSKENLRSGNEPTLLVQGTALGKKATWPLLSVAFTSLIINNRLCWWMYLSLFFTSQAWEWHVRRIWWEQCEDQPWVHSNGQYPKSVENDQRARWRHVMVTNPALPDKSWTTNWTTTCTYSYIPHIKPNHYYILLLLLLRVSCILCDLELVQSSKYLLSYKPTTPSFKQTLPTNWH